MNKPGHTFPGNLVALTLALLVLLVLITACAVTTGRSPQRTLTPANTSAPEAALGGKTTSVPEVLATAAPSATGGFECADVNQIPAAECTALVTLYNSTNGPDWLDSSGWLTANTPCSWTGITCMDDHVSDINLAHNQLTGPLPAALGRLSYLRVLALGSNRLNGPLPAELGNLAELVCLYLWGNLLVGPLPVELGNLRKLQDLSLADNQLSGSIPTALGRVKSLRSLDLSHNQFGGEVPTELGNLDNLYVLDLSHNQLGGAIPSALGGLSQLEELDLSHNQFRGVVPESVSHIPQLMLWGNQFKGTITTDGQAPFMVDFGGIHFSANPSLATSIWPEVKQATPLPGVPEGPSYWLAFPEHMRFTLADPDLPSERRRMGFSLAAEGQILVFPLARLADMNPLIRTQLETLQSLLAERGPLPSAELPLLPLTNSAQVFHAQAQYFDTDNIQGIRFLSQHSQEPHPIVLSQEIFYTFQGFTDDDMYYVAAFFPLTTMALPDRIEVKDWEAFHANYDTYLLETAAFVDQLPPTGFTPVLTLLDAVITSFRTEPGKGIEVKRTPE